jgi:phenylpropionate dioxygenase-like ring-hydroxylating dioxygenase large terminal subunit
LSKTPLEQCIEAGLAYEGAREGYPEGFPPRLRIPAERYISPEFQRLENEHLWRKTWLCAGRDEEVPDIGSFKRFDRLDRPMLIVRGRDGRIRALNNICRHRGALLVSTACGKAARLTCPYHAWTYELSGELLAPTERRDFSGLVKSDLSLGEVRCETWQGWIFITLNPDADPLAIEMQRVGEEMASFSMAQLRLQGHRIYPVKCNWKATQDAFLESYHVQFIHPTTAGPIVHPQRIALALFERGHSRMAMGKRTNVDGGTYAGQMPADCDIPTVPELFRKTFVAWHLFPNIISPADAGGFPFVIFWPTSANTTDIELYLVGWDREKNEAVAQYWKAMLDGLDFIMAEDTQFLDGIQKSIEAPVLAEMQIGYQERRIYWTHEEIDRRIGIDRIPASMRIEQRLGPFTR